MSIIIAVISLFGFLFRYPAATLTYLELKEKVKNLYRATRMELPQTPEGFIDMLSRSAKQVFYISHLPTLHFIMYWKSSTKQSI